MGSLHFFLVIVGICAVAVSSGSSQDGAASAFLKDPHFDPDERLIRGGLSDNLKQSLELIEKAKTLPSCGKIATSALLHSCSALELSINHDDQLPAGSDLLLQEESDIYAARLAVCELSGADFSVPNECRSFIPSPNGKKTTFAGWINFGKGPSKPRIANDYYDQVTTTNLKQCRRALGSSGQAWTSYSNNRQNAVAMCHAMQGAVERDESRHIAKILTSTAAATTESLHDAQEQADQIRRHFHELRTAMPNFQEDLASFDTNIQQTVQQFWSHFDQARSAVEELATSIDHVQGSSRDVRVVLAAVLETHLPELAAAVIKAKQDIADSTDNAVASTEMVAYHQERMMQDAVTRLTAAGHSLDTINEKMPQLSEVIEMNIRSSLGFYDRATQRQLELLAGQNKSMDGLERINQKAAEMNMHMGEAIAKASAIVEDLHQVNSMLGPLVSLQDFFVTTWKIVVCSFALGLLSIPFFHDCLDCKFKSSLCLAIVVVMVSALMLSCLRSQLAALSEAISSSDLQLSTHAVCFVGGVLACVFLLSLVAALKHVSRRSRRQSLPSEDYDPTSPPAGLLAYAIRLHEAAREQSLVPWDRPSPLPKRGV